MTPMLQIYISAAPFLHDAALLYAYVADGMLRHGKDPRDGAEFLRYAPRVQFDGENHLCHILESYLVYWIAVKFT